MIVRYRVPEEHHTTTVKGEEEIAGSVHHESLREFTGLVTRSHDDGTHDLVVFPPNRSPIHVDRVPEAHFDWLAGKPAAKK